MMITLVDFIDGNFIGDGKKTAALIAKQQIEKKRTKLPIERYVVDDS